MESISVKDFFLVRFGSKSIKLLLLSKIMDVLYQYFRLLCFRVEIFKNTVAPGETTVCKFLITFQEKKEPALSNVQSLSKGIAELTVLVVFKIRPRTRDYKPHSLTSLKSSSKT